MTRDASRRAAWLLFVLPAGCPASSTHADQLLLRDLTRLADVRVDGFDEDGVRLADGRRIGWDAIERGTVAPADQPRFDESLRSLGEPLFRIRKRLDAGDYRNLLDEASALYPSYASRRSASAYAVCQALMWANLAAGRREDALQPYLRCFDYLRTLPDEAVELPGARRLSHDRRTGLSSDLLPIWFDAEAAARVLPGVLAAVAEMAEPRPEGTRIYYATMAATVGQVEESRRVLEGIVGREAELLQLREVALAQCEVAEGKLSLAAARLAPQVEQLAAPAQLLARYWLGMAWVDAEQRETRDRGLLQLLHLPALHGDREPELAAAALFQAARVFDSSQQQDAAASVRRELLQRYGQTYHAAKLRSGSSPGKGS